MSYEDLRPEFREGCDSLITRVLQRPKLKTIKGKHITGAMLLGMAIEYVATMNSHEIPSVISTFERVAHAEA